MCILFFRPISIFGPKKIRFNPLLGFPNEWYTILYIYYIHTYVRTYINAFNSDSICEFSSLYEGLTTDVELCANISTFSQALNVFHQYFIFSTSIYTFVFSNFPNLTAAEIIIFSWERGKKSWIFTRKSYALHLCANLNAFDSHTGSGIMVSQNNVITESVRFDRFWIENVHLPDLE